MKHTRFVGTFRNSVGHSYELQVYAFSFFEAFFLLTADAIRNGTHYQLSTIINDKAEIRLIDDIHKSLVLFS